MNRIDNKMRPHRLVSLMLILFNACSMVTLMVLSDGEVYALFIMGSLILSVVVVAEVFKRKMLMNCL